MARGWECVALRIDSSRIPTTKWTQGVSTKIDFFSQTIFNPSILYAFSDISWAQRLESSLLRTRREEVHHRESFACFAGLADSTQWDILFARSGGTVGKAFIFKEKYGRCAFAGYLIRAQIATFCCSEFIYYYTQSRCYDEWKKQIFIQATIQNIGADRYSTLEVPIPPLDEQQSIASYLDTKCHEIDSLIELKRQKIEALKDYKKSVIFEAVTGKTDIINYP